MKANNSFYPVTITNEYNNNMEFVDGISIRDKLAHDYMCAILSRNDLETGNFGMPVNIDNLIDSCFELADKMIRYSN